MRNATTTRSTKTNSRQSSRSSSRRTQQRSREGGCRRTRRSAPRMCGLATDGACSCCFVTPTHRGVCRVDSAESKDGCCLPFLLQLLEIFLREELLRVLQGRHRLRALVQVLQLQKSSRHSGRRRDEPCVPSRCPAAAWLSLNDLHCTRADLFGRACGPRLRDQARTVRTDQRGRSTWTRLSTVRRCLDPRSRCMQSRRCSQMMRQCRMWARV